MPLKFNENFWVSKKRRYISRFRKSIFREKKGKGSGIKLCLSKNKHKEKRKIGTDVKIIRDLVFI